jgi:hypothetical protein
MALVLAALVLAPLGLVAAPAARAAATDLTVVTSTRYIVEPSRKRVRVVVEATIANHRADTKTNRYYFDHAFLAVQPGAASPAMAKGTKSGSVKIASRKADSTVLRLNFGKKLYGGKTMSVAFSFTLADVGSGARRLIRVGTSLITFPVWAYATDGATGSRVVVQFPKGYDVTVESGSFATQGKTSAGGTLLGTGAIADPLKYFAYLSAQQPATYRSSPLNVAVSGGTIRLALQSWKDDRAWGTRVGGLFRRSLPILRDDIGLAWPHDTPVVVREAVSRSTGGFAGLYDPQANEVQVAYWASSAVIIHEAAHGWFNGTLVADRWAAEGFASFYAQRALKSLKIKSSVPTLTAKLKAAAFPLNAWPATPAPATTSEAYGYAGSYMLASLIARRAGTDALARVWAAAEAHVGAYQPPAAQGADPETVAGPPDWRGVLDLLETETKQDFTDLWRTWVVRPAEVALLDQRAAARSDYASLMANMDGWAMPRSVRDALRAWQFSSARAQLASARQALAERASLEVAAATAGLALPGTMRQLFESGNFASAVTEAQAERAAIAAIGEAAASGTTAKDLETTVGMIGANPDADLARAKAALAAGDTTGATAAAATASRTWADAHFEGRRRLLMGIATVAALGVLVLSLLSHLRGPGRFRLERPARRPAEPPSNSSLW